MKSEMIKSVQFCDNFFPVVDGVVETVHNYARIMNEQTRCSVVVPCSFNRNQFDDSSLPYDVYRTKSIRLILDEYAIPMPKFDKGLKSFLDTSEADIFHAHSPFFEGEYAVSYGKKHGIPVVATFHSKFYDDAINVTGSKLIANAVKNKVVRFFNRVDSVWSCSEGTAGTLRSYGFEGDIFVIDNGSSLTYPDNPDKLARAAREKYSLQAGKKIILFVGHLIWHKNLKLILDSFRLVISERDDFVLVITGDGYDGEKIKEYSDSLNFPDGSVIFTGRVFDRELLEGVYLNADLFFFPSVYDNSPLVLREAAALRVPSLLTEGSNSSEAVIKDKTGFTAAENPEAMHDEIIKIFDTPGLLENVSEAAMIQIPKSWESLTEKVREKYAQVIEEYKKRIK